MRSFNRFVIALALIAAPVTAQPRWTPTAAIGASGMVCCDRAGGPLVALISARLQLLRNAGGRFDWGASLAYYNFGRFDDPVPGDYYDAKAVALGVAARSCKRAVCANLGLDLLRYHEGDRMTTGSDPAVSLYLGAAYLPGRSRSRGVFVEAGIHPFLSLGEYTHSNGAWASMLVGFAFR